jgi:signal transduction histidine kinase
VNLLEPAEKAMLAVRAEAEKKRISLTVAGEPVAVRADKNRIEQVVTNLLSNAVKYTPDGGEVAVTVSESGKNGVITVTDNGRGIPAEDLPYVFERFYRVDKSRSRASGGSGIGLAIVKSIVTAHGGKVKAESELGRWSRFKVTLPK